MIFDEIDVGVSGRVSQAIAQKLHDLSQQHQVLCVTHQPLIAAMADRHFRVHKTVVDRAARPGATVLEAAQEMTAKATGEGAGVQERTIVSVELLADLAARQRELAELAGGESAQEALTFAESLLTQAADRRHLSGTEEATAAPGETPEAESTPLAKSSRRPSTKKTAKSTSSSQKTNQGRPSGQGRAKATRKSRSGS